MPADTPDVRAWWQRGLVGKITGCALVSAGSTVASQLLLFVLAVLWPPAIANVAVVTATSVPAYAANRRWVWRVEHNRRAAVAFLAVNLAGLLVSTAAVAWAASTWHGHWVVNAASIASWVVLWPLSFVLNDRVLFRDLV